MNLKASFMGSVAGSDRKNDQNNIQVMKKNDVLPKP